MTAVRSLVYVALFYVWTAAVAISTLIALDGESNWLEGALLMLVYFILAFSFFEFVSPL